MAPEKSWLWPPTAPVFGGQDCSLLVWFRSIQVHLCLWSVHGNDLKGLKKICLLVNDLLLFLNGIIKSGFEDNIKTKIHLSFQRSS